VVRFVRGDVDFEPVAPLFDWTAVPPQHSVLKHSAQNTNAVQLASRVMRLRMHPYQGYALRFLLMRCSPTGLGNVIAKHCSQSTDERPDLRLLENVPEGRCVLPYGPTKRIVFQGNREYVKQLPKCGFAILNMARGMGKTLVATTFAIILNARKRKAMGLRRGERRPLTMQRRLLRRPAPDLFRLRFTQPYLDALGIRAPFCDLSSDLSAVDDEPGSISAAASAAATAQPDSAAASSSSSSSSYSGPASGAGAGSSSSPPNPTKLKKSNMRSMKKQVQRLADECPQGPYPSLLSRPTTSAAAASLEDLPPTFGLSGTQQNFLSELRPSGLCLKGKTLVIAPPSVLGEWEDALRHSSVPQKTIRWEGSGRHARLAMACDADFVLVSSSLMSLERDRFNKDVSLPVPMAASVGVKAITTKRALHESFGLNSAAARVYGYSRHVYFVRLGLWAHVSRENGQWYATIQSKQFIGTDEDMLYLRPAIR
jgi:hypothetical protein